LESEIRFIRRFVMKTKCIFTFFPLYFTLLFILSVAVILSPVLAAGSALDMDVRPENSTLLYRSDGTSTIQIRVIVPDDFPIPDRPPLNLALVLDKSGSMADEGKIDYVRQAAHMLVNRMGPEDRLTIVTYDNRVRVPIGANRVRNRQRFHRIIDGIYPGGRTYLSGGLEEGFRQAKRYRKKGFVSRVILLSDGLANIGLTDPRQLSRRASIMYESGVAVSTFGMGYDFDENLLASMATGGGGSYHYISRPGDILAALQREFNMASRTVASGVEIIIRPMDGCRFDSAPGHGWRLEGGSAIIGLGDLSAGETRTLMARLSVPTRSLGDQSVADIAIRYRDPLTGKTSTLDRPPVSLEVVDDPSVYRENYDIEVQEKKAVIESNAMMEEAARKVDRGDRDGALSIIRKVMGALKSSPAASAPALQQEMERANEYGGRLEGLDDMAPAEVKEMQKDLKYRGYQELHQQ
jgi:Ca-activated chloride channel family protein